MSNRAPTAAERQTRKERAALIPQQIRDLKAEHPVLSGLGDAAVRFVPVVGDVLDLSDALKEARAGNYGWAALSGLAAVPLVGSVANWAKATKQAERLFKEARFLERMADAMEQYSPQTQEHSVNTARYLRDWLTARGAPLAKTQVAAKAAYGHDIGKLKVSREVLESTKSPLAPHEVNLMAQHTKYGARMWEQAPPGPTKELGKRFAAQHHSHALALADDVQKMKVVDVYDALTGKRSYPRRIKGQLKLTVRPAEAFEIMLEDKSIAQEPLRDFIQWRLRDFPKDFNAAEKAWLLKAIK